MTSVIQNCLLELRTLLEEPTTPVKADFTHTQRLVLPCLQRLASFLDIATGVVPPTNDQTPVDSNTAIVPSASAMAVWDVLEELTVSRRVSLGPPFQVALLRIYERLSTPPNAPGFVSRYVVSAMLRVINHKTVSVAGRELAFQVITAVVTTRGTDVAASASDIALLCHRYVRALEAPIRVASLACLGGLLVGSSGRFTDLYAETLRTAVRAIADRSNAETRVGGLRCIVAMIEGGSVFTIHSAEVLHAALVKSLEDEAASVQLAAIRAVATLFNVQINAFLLRQEQQKTIGDSAEGAGPNGTANGTTTGPNSAAKPKVPSQASKFTASFAKFTSSRKTIEDAIDLRAVLYIILRSWGRVGASSTARTSWLFVLGFVVREAVDAASQEELVWLVEVFISLNRDTSVSGTTFEEQNTFRARLSFLFRHAITSRVPTEALSVELICQLAQKSINGDGAATEGEVQFCLLELTAAFVAVGVAALGVAEEAVASAMINLRHSALGIRLAAASLLETISLVCPGFAPKFFESAFAGAQTQVAQLLSDEDSADVEDTLTVSAPDGSTTPSATGSAATTPSARRRVPSNSALQRMYSFHGHTLLLAALLRRFHLLVTPLRAEQFSAAFRFGLDMLRTELSSTDIQVTCSVVRAGGLLVSACLSLGYELCNPYISDLLTACRGILQDKIISSPQAPQTGSTTPGSSTGTTAASSSSTEVLYDVMCMEAAVVCLSALLQYAKEALFYESHCITSVIELLEIAFIQWKTSLAVSEHRSHYRVRAVQLLLLEAFTMLPPGSFGPIGDELLAEALRLLGDAVRDGLECSYSFLLSDGASAGTFAAHKSTAAGVALGGGSAGGSNSSATPAAPPVSDAGWLGDRSGNGGDVDALVDGTLQFLSADSPNSEWEAMLRLEVYSVALQKREAEASLTNYGSSEDASLPFLLHAVNASFTAAELLEGRRVGVNALCLLLQTNAGPRSSLMDTRTVDSALRLLRATFPFQPPESQERTVSHLLSLLSFSQSHANGSSSSGTMSSYRLTLSAASKGMSLFASDEERKRRERKATAVVRTVLAACNSVVSATPVSQFRARGGGSSQDSYEPEWPTQLSERLYELLGHSDATLRNCAARVLAMTGWKIQWKSSNNCVGALSGRIRSSILASLARRTVNDSSPAVTSLVGGSSTLTNTVAPEQLGYALCLGHLATAGDRIHRSARETWTERRDFLGLTQLSLLDCLHRPDGSAPALAHAVLSLAVLTQTLLDDVVPVTTVDSANTIHSTSSTVSSVLAEGSALLQADIDDFLDRIVYGAETLLAGLPHGENWAPLFAALLRLLSLCMCLSQRLSGEKHREALCLLWTQVFHLVSYTGRLSARLSAQDDTPLLLECLALVTEADPSGPIASYALTFAWDAVGPGGLHTLTITALSPAVRIYAAVFSTHISISKQTRLMVNRLYTLLDTCLAAQSMITSTAGPNGLEIRSDSVHWSEFEAKSSGRSGRLLLSALRKIRLSLESVVRRDVIGHHRGGAEMERGCMGLTFWVMFHRALTLGQSFDSVALPDEDLDEAVATRGGTTSGETSAATTSTDTTFSVSSWVELATLFRDLISRNVPRLGASLRLQVRCLSLHMMNLAFATAHDAAIPLLTDFTACRSAAMDVISSYNGRLTADSLLQANLSPFLFLQDLLNVACANATHTVNDQTLAPLQFEALTLLHVLVTSVAASRDPDLQLPPLTSTNGAAFPLPPFTATRCWRTGEAPPRIVLSELPACQLAWQVLRREETESAALAQCLSQCLGAVRSCFSIDGESVLTDRVSDLILILLSRGLLSDRVAIRRLLKPLATFTEETLPQIQWDSTPTEDMDTLRRYLSAHALLARLFVLTSGGVTLALHPVVLQSLRLTEASVTSTLDTIFSSSTVSLLVKNWRFLVSDSLRLLTAEVFGDTASAGRGGWTYCPRLFFNHSLVFEHLNAGLTAALALLHALPIPSSRNNNENSEAATSRREEDFTLLTSFVAVTLRYADLASSSLSVFVTRDAVALRATALELFALLSAYQSQRLAAGAITALDIDVPLWTSLLSDAARLLSLNTAYSASLSPEEIQCVPPTLSCDTCLLLLSVVWQVTGWDEDFSSKAAEPLLSLVMHILFAITPAAFDVSMSADWPPAEVTLPVPIQISGPDANLLLQSRLASIRGVISSYGTRQIIVTRAAHNAGLQTLGLLAEKGLLRILPTGESVGLILSHALVSSILASALTLPIGWAIHPQAEASVSLGIATRTICLSQEGIEGLRTALSDVLSVVTSTSVDFAPEFISSTISQLLILWTSIPTPKTLPAPLQSTLLKTLSDQSPLFVPLASSVIRVLSEISQQSSSKIHRCLLQRLLCSLVLVGLSTPLTGDLSLSLAPTAPRAFLVRLVPILQSQLVSTEESSFYSIIMRLLCRDVSLVRPLATPFAEEYCTICGRALTHLARQNAEFFKEQVSHLDETSRAGLQHAMASALARDQQAPAVTQRSSAPNISADRFR